MATNALPIRWVRFEDDDDKGTAFERACLAAAFLTRHLPEIPFRPSMAVEGGIEIPLITMVHENTDLLDLAYSALQACGSTRVDHIPYPLR